MKHYQGFALTFVAVALISIGPAQAACWISENNDYICDGGEAQLNATPGGNNPAPIGSLPPGPIQTDVNQVLADFQAAQSQLETCTTDMRTAADTYDAENEALVPLADTASTDYQTYTVEQGQADVAEGELVQANDELSAANNTLDAASSDLQDALAAQDAADADLADAQAIMDGLQADLQAAQDIYNAAVAAEATAQLAVDSATAAVATATTDVATAQAAYDACVAAASPDCSVEQAALDAANASLTTANADLTTAQADLTTAQADVTAAQPAVTDAQAAVDAYQPTYDAAVAASGAASSDVTSTQSAYDQATAEQQAASDAQAQAQATYDQEQAEADTALATYEQSEAALNDQQAAVDAASQELDSLMNTCGNTADGAGNTTSFGGAGLGGASGAGSTSAPSGNNVVTRPWNFSATVTNPANVVEASEVTTPSGYDTGSVSISSDTFSTVAITSAPGSFSPVDPDCIASGTNATINYRVGCDWDNDWWCNMNDNGVCYLDPNTTYYINTGFRLENSSASTCSVECTVTITNN